MEEINVDFKEVDPARPLTERDAVTRWMNFSMFKDYLLDPDIPKERLEFRKIRISRFEIINRLHEKILSEYMRKPTSEDDWIMVDGLIHEAFKDSVDPYYEGVFFFIAKIKGESDEV